MNQSILEVKSLAVKLPLPAAQGAAPAPILRDVSLRLANCEVLGLMGASGSGKSTLLRALARLIEPDGGRVLLEGRDWDEFTPQEYRRKVCLLPQVPVALPGSVEDNLEFVFQLHRELPRADPGQLLQDVNLSPRLLTQAADSMSVGEKQRLVLARALALSPRVLLLDEPTSALDDANARQVLDLLAQVCARRGLSAILATHIAGHLRIAHRKLTLSNGTVTQHG